MFETPVIVCDDHPLVIEGMEALLSTSSDFIFERGCTSPSEALEVLKPENILLADISFPSSPMNGIDLCRRASDKRIRVLMCSVYSESRYGAESRRAGALGYVQKSADAPGLLNALRNVARGQHHFSSESASQQNLTPREKDLVGLIVQGLSPEDCASSLSLSKGRIYNIRTQLSSKLGVDTRRLDSEVEKQFSL